MPAAEQFREVDGAELRTEIERGGRLLVEFWAPWCPQCGPMEGVIRRVAESLPSDISVLKVNAEDEAVAAEYGITGLPLVLLFVDGGHVASIHGYKRAPVLREELLPYLSA